MIIIIRRKIQHVKHADMIYTVATLHVFGNLRLLSIEVMYKEKILRNEAFLFF